MKTRIFAMLVVLFVFAGFMFAQDDEAERKQKEAAAKVEAEKQAAEKAEREKKELEQTKNDIQTLLNEYCKALNAKDLDKIIECCYFEDEKFKKELKEKYRDELKRNQYSFKEFKVNKVKILDKLAVVNYTYKIKNVSDMNGQWIEDYETDFFKKTEKGWRLYPGAFSMWSEAKVALGCMKAATDTYCAKTGGDLSILDSKDWQCISKYYDTFRIEPEAFKSLQYFDEKDFVIKLKTTDDDVSDHYIIKCRASLDNGRGESKKGPEFGMVQYNSETGEWTEDYLADYKKPETKEEKKEPKLKPKTDDEE